MDKILFKAIRKGNGEWIYGDLVHNTTDAYSRYIEVGIRAYGCYPEEVHPETVCQYIGSEDKNMKNMFSGDILKTPDNENQEITKVVTYNKLKCKFEVWLHFREIQKKPFLVESIHPATSQEVIGNIFDIKK